MLLLVNSLALNVGAGFTLEEGHLTDNPDKPALYPGLGRVYLSYGWVFIANGRRQRAFMQKGNIDGSRFQYLALS
jgi:hypothetical protein